MVDSLGTGTPTRDSMLQQEQAVATENAPVALVCPDCQGKLHRENAQLVCGKCGTVGRYLDGVPCFTDPEYYWGEVPLEKMRLANQVAEARGWETAVNEVVAEAKLREYICDPRRADFQHIWDLPANATVLDIGAGWGAIASGLAPHFSRVVAAEGVYERTRFIEKRTRQAGLNGVQAVCADFLRLPFGAEQFDAIVLNGVLEWVGLARQDGDPRELQLQFLRRVREMLKPSGLVCVGIENRVGWDMIRGGGDHSGLSYTSLMPRSMARYWCRRHARRFRSDKNAGYRTYTYSIGGFRKLFREAGFEGFRPYHAYDGYNNPSTLLPLDNTRALLHFVDRMELGKSGWRGRVRETILRGAALTGLWRECASEFIFVLNKQ